MNEGDLPRWADSEDELPEELRVWLRNGGAGLGSASEVAELRQRLASVLGPTAGLGGSEPPSGGSSSGDPSSGGAPAPTQAAAVGQSLGRWGWGVLGGMGIALGVWVFGGRSPATPAPSPPAAPVAAASEPSPHTLAPAPPALQQPALAPQPRLETAPPTRAVRRPASSKPSRPPSLGEAVLLERARNALSASPATALALTREHDRRFPRGVLAQESEVIAIEALKRMGREAAAAQRTAEFERRYRGSVHRQRLGGAGGAPR